METGVLAKLQEKLAKGVAHFTFQKTNGDHREAFGTTNGSIIPKYSDKAVQSLIDNSIITAGNLRAVSQQLKDAPTTSEMGGVLDKFEKAIEPFLPKDKKQHTRSEEVVTFFDVEKQAWRSCRTDSILGIH